MVKSFHDYKTTDKDVMEDENGANEGNQYNIMTFDTLLFTFILTHPSFVYPEFHSVLSMTKTLKNNVIELTDHHNSTINNLAHCSDLANNLRNGEANDIIDNSHNQVISNENIQNMGVNKEVKTMEEAKINKDVENLPKKRCWRIDKLEEHYSDIIYCQADLSTFQPHAFLKFPSSQIKEVELDVKNFFLQRCVLLEFVNLFYKDYNDFKRDCLTLLMNGSNLFNTFKIDIVTTNKRLTLDQVKAYREKYVHWITMVARFVYGNDESKYPRVDLKSPDVTFAVLLDFEKLGKKPIGEYFTRKLGDSNRRFLMGNFALNKREYIGTTSMTPMLSFLSANQALVSNSLVLDPFVGTGSILVSCAHFGSYVMGTDLDIRVLKGNNEKNLHSNFKQYGLENKVMFDVFRTCLSQQSIWRCSEIFDAIVTDPPYGKRESASKIGRKQPLKHGVTGDDHIPSRIQYGKVELMHDFLNLSARLLKVGGRLVYWLISDILFRIEEDLPKHPCFKLICISENRLSKKHSRRLITMEKILPYNEGMALLEKQSRMVPRCEPSSDTARIIKKQKLNEDIETSAVTSL